MGRNRGPDISKIEKIAEVLQKNRDGLWIMEISRKTNISKSTVQRYLTTYMKDSVIEVRSFSELIKLYKLR